MLTAEQKAANAALTEAVERDVRAYDLVDRSAVLVDFMVIFEGLVFDDDGEVSEEHYGICYRDGNTRSVVVLGLIEKGRQLILDQPTEEAGDD